MENSEKTLRDELAMSMPVELLPTINDLKTIEEISAKLGIEWDNDDTMAQIEWSLKYQAAIRYMYADAMLVTR